MTMTRAAALGLMEQIRAQHVPDGQWLCGVHTDGAVEPEENHQYSENRRPKVLTCHSHAGHTGRHRDSRCCWQPHEFDGGVQGKREDWRMCSCGVRYSECKTAATLDAAEFPMGA